MLICLLLVDSISGFVQRPTFHTAFASCELLRLDPATQRTDSSFNRDVHMMAATTSSESAVTLQDFNGKDIAMGCIVRVSAKGLKAFQIQPKGRGSYDAAKAFVADSDSKYLVLPEGLRGKVTKTYNDMDEVSANFPVQVKFMPDQETDEGYAAPVPFLMHFTVDEVECV